VVLSISSHSPNLTSFLNALVGQSPARGIDDDSHETAGKDSRHREGNNPAKVDPCNHAPVDGSPSAIAQTHTDCGTRDTLSGGDGELCRLLVQLRSANSKGYGILSLVAMMTVMAEPSSMEKPRDGECRVILLPRLRMML
jgi:hypothetical protein